MATQEEILQVVSMMETLSDSRFLPRVNERQMGIGAVLRLLKTSETPVTAGRISETMHVSTARVAALLNKMADRGMITRTKSPKDGRVVVVTLTEEGEKTVSLLWEDLCGQIAQVVDGIGMARLTDFFETIQEIEQLVSGPPDLAFCGKCDFLEKP